MIFPQYSEGNMERQARSRVAVRILEVSFAAIALVYAAGTAPAVRAQLKGGGGVLPVAPGEQVFGKTCAQCHAGPHPANRAPSEQTLEKMTPEAIYASVTTGVMAP